MERERVKVYKEREREVSAKGREVEQVRHMARVWRREWTARGRVAQSQKESRDGGGRGSR